MSRYALVIDHEACWGCGACEVACAQEHEFKAKFLHAIEEGPTNGGATNDYMYRVKVCLHCDDPACVDACAEDAITKRPDGLVILDPERCTGCQACVEACPEGGIWFDEADQRAFKCNMCDHRVDRGLIPACADNVCLAHCIYFGDPASIQKKIEEKRKKRQTK